ncbi:hypothetical protein CPT_Suso_056 [Stenotrophomonas phage Suso]|nr:hypothetical protein CPT_Suso_056 [Stenotrophomonas phage Suso]
MSNGDIPCPRCGRYYSRQGVLDHMRDLHHITRRDAGNLVAAAQAQAKPKPKPAQDDDDGAAWVFRALAQQNKEHRAAMLAKADTTGWQQLSPYHYRRWFYDTRVDWWPSGGKAQVFTKGSGQPPQMVYGHRRVAALVERLKGVERAG